jgi:transcriptional antiterminator RfaH
MTSIPKTTTPMTSARWFVVQTQAHSEIRASQHLERQGFETYLPRYLKRRRHSRKVDTIAAPLFPRYLFVAIDMQSQRWRSIHSTIGVSRLVTNGNEPVALVESVIDGLRRREDASGFIQFDPAPSFSVGDKIRVAAGAFADALGLFEGVGDRARVAILLDLLGRKVRVMLDTEMVVAA